jgi:hypothetical protein
MLNQLYSTLGQNHDFDDFVMKIMFEILSVRLITWESVLGLGQSLVESMSNS